MSTSYVLIVFALVIPVSYTHLEYREDRPGDAWGAITVWAWAASRIMDYFETDPLICLLYTSRCV